MTLIRVQLLLQTQVIAKFGAQRGGDSYFSLFDLAARTYVLLIFWRMVQQAGLSGLNQCWRLHLKVCRRERSDPLENSAEPKVVWWVTQSRPFELVIISW